MSQRWRYVIFYTAGTRKPILLNLYRCLLKRSLRFKSIDNPSGLWFFTETKLLFRQNKNLNKIDDVIKCYEKGIEYKIKFDNALDNVEESQKELIKEGYGQKGKRKIDFLGAYCFEHKENFSEIAEFYSHNIPIPREYGDYMENNGAGMGVYKGIFGADYDFKNLYKQNIEYEELIAWYKKVFFRKYQLECSQKGAEEMKKRKEELRQKNERNKAEEDVNIFFKDKP